ncbi:LysR family transcriptional regulator [Paraglaciecola sp. 2405UD69-4]|uniref:LysR family transcriptional regulator n=1 Tax=Paraglaciecola sp. 2405UD69-4 TaxID=3391836 RepID=UPI0039C9DEB6
MADYNRIQQLDLNLLKIFESIYKEQNMSRSAEALHITPSAVSHALKRLRECLGDPLFQRSNNKMLPTPACQRMAPQIIDTLSRLRQILQHWGEFQPLTSEHHFKLGIHYALEPSILPKLVKCLAQLAPNTSFSSVKIDRENLTRALGAGHIDMAFDVALPIKPPVFHTKVIDDSFSVLMAQGHKLQGYLNQANYLAAKHVGVSNRPSGAAAEDILFQQQGYSRQINIRCQNYYAAKAIVAESEYLLTLPSQLGRELLGGKTQTPALVLLDMPIATANIETHLYWHKNTEQDEALSWFRQVLSSLGSV